MGKPRPNAGLCLPTHTANLLLPNRNKALSSEWPDRALPQQVLLRDTFTTTDSRGTLM